MDVSWLSLLIFDKPIMELLRIVNEESVLIPGVEAAFSVGIRGAGGGGGKGDDEVGVGGGVG